MPIQEKICVNPVKEATRTRLGHFFLLIYFMCFRYSCCSAFASPRATYLRSISSHSMPSLLASSQAADITRSCAPHPTYLPRRETKRKHGEVRAKACGVRRDNSRYPMRCSWQLFPC